MSDVIKLSSPDTHEFWEIAVLFEDDQLLALNKPAHLLTRPNRLAQKRPNLMRLLHEAVASEKPSVRQRGLQYVMPAHRLDEETSGVLLLAKSKSVLIQLAEGFSSEKPLRTFLALAHGVPPEKEFEINLPLAGHAGRRGVTRVDLLKGKKARTLVRQVERFIDFSLLECRPLTERHHQIRAHLKHHRMPLCGDMLYGGRPLLLSRLKPDYRFKDKETEKPLMQRPALHAAAICLPHPRTGEPLTIQAPWPKDLTAAVKYLRRFAAAGT